MYCSGVGFANRFAPVWVPMNVRLAPRLPDGQPMVPVMAYDDPRIDHQLNMPSINLRRSLLFPLIVVAAGVTLISCGDDRLPAPPTAIVPLPADAPPDAAAPSGTTRVTVTAIQIFTPDGRVADAAALQGDSQDGFRAWIFCPSGLEGDFEYAVPSIGLSGCCPQLKPGYNDVRGGVFIQRTPGSYPFRFDVIREFVTVASKEIILVVSP
jgi:hypothetical protein